MKSSKFKKNGKTIKDKKSNNVSFFTILNQNRWRSGDTILAIKKGINIDKISYEHKDKSPLTHLLIYYDDSIILKYALKKSKYLNIYYNKIIKNGITNNDNRRFLLKLGYNFYKQYDLINYGTELIFSVCAISVYEKNNNYHESINDDDYGYYEHDIEYVEYDEFDDSGFNIYLQTLI